MERAYESEITDGWERRVVQANLDSRAQETEPLTLSGTTAALFAHEVANPLQGISAALEFVKNDLEGAKYDVRVLISTIRRALLEIDRLGSLLHEFRSIACPQTTHYHKINLADATKEVLSCQRHAYAKAGITVKLEFDDALPWVMADPDKIKQVVLNLCNNAVEAMPGGGCMSVKGYRLAHMVVLEISDTGTGIPPGLNVFELFTTTKTGGSGLGLPLVRQIVLAHNGTINYTDVPMPGRGTTFKVHLPYAEFET
jgi:signal transduction histidine kinase